MLTRRILLAFSIVAGFCASSLSSVAQEKANITIWLIPISEPYVQWWNDHIAAFNSENPDIEVTAEYFTTDAYQPKVTAALAAGTIADVISLPAGPQGFEAVRQGKLQSLDGIIDRSLIAAPAAEACSVDGKLACLPLYVAAHYFFYNKDHFETAGIDVSQWADPHQPTWAEFTDAADKLQAAGILPIAHGTADGWAGAMYFWAFQDRYSGLKEYQDAVNGVGGLTYSTAPGFIKAAEAVAEFGKGDWLPLGYTGIGGGQKYTLFTSGRAGMTYQGPWMHGRIAAEAPEGFRFGLFKFPTIEGGDPESQQSMVGGFNSIYMSGTSEHPEAAAKLLQSYLEHEAGLSFTQQTQNPSIINSVIEATTGSDDVVAEVATMVAGSPHIYPFWDNYMTPVVVEESWRLISGLYDGSVTPAEYLAALDKAQGR